MSALSHPSGVELKHPRAIRWMHWINFPLLFTMIWSGLLIYWADSIPNVGHQGEVYRLGLGSHTLFRFFPERFWQAIGAEYKLTTGLGYHFFFMWLFIINGIAYVSYLTLSGEWRLIVPDRRSLRDAFFVIAHDLHLRRTAPAQRKYNAAQRIAYTLVILMGVGVVITGFAIWKPTSFAFVTRLCGGYERARWLHFWLTIGFLAFFVVHVVQVALAGWNNFAGMVRGWVRTGKEGA